MRQILFTAIICMTFGSLATAQNYPHPRDMDIPKTTFKRPDPGRYQLKLDNGLTAYVVKEDNVPLVTLSAFIRAGKIDGAAEGAAESLENALRSSASGQALKKMTARYTVTMHDEWTEVSLNVPSEDLNEALTLFAGVLKAPAVRQEDINSASRRAISEVATDDNGVIIDGKLNVAIDKFNQGLYQDHIYGKKLTFEDFYDLRISDVEAYHQTYFVPGNMTLAISGDIDEALIKSALEDHFGGMDANAAPARVNIPAVIDKAGERYYYPADKLQTWIVIGHSLPKVPLEEEAALQAMNYILAGGHFWTRMFSETRDKYGLTNDASGFLIEHWDGAGSYQFHTYSRPEVLKTLYDNVMGEVLKIADSEISDDELMVAQNAHADGLYEIQYVDGNATARSFAIEMLRYGNHDRSASYPERMRAVTKADVIKAAQKYIRPDQLQLIVVGDDIKLK